MGKAAYNRDQRIANAIVDALIDLGAHDPKGAVSEATVFRACCAGKSVHELGELTKARVSNMIGILVEYGAVRSLPNGDGIDVFHLDVLNYRGVRDVARGVFP
jgi:hypothetical protein